MLCLCVVTTQFSKRHELERLRAHTDRRSLADILSLAKKEDEMNKLQYARQLGSPLHFCEIYQLRHVESGDWLCCESINSSTSGQHGTAQLRIVLVGKYDISKHCWFKLNPAYKTTKAGSAIMSQDCVTIESVVTGLLVQTQTPSSQNASWDARAKETFVHATSSRELGCAISIISVAAKEKKVSSVAPRCCRR